MVKLGQLVCSVFGHWNGELLAVFANNNKPSLYTCSYFGFVFDGVGGLEHSWAVGRLDGIFVLHGGRCGECAVCRVWIAV